MNPVTDTLCRWDVPGGAGSLFLTASTVRDLRAKAIEAFLSIPRRGVEVGGLLLGREQNGQIFIQGAEEIECEHRYGPSYTLSDADHEALASRIARANGDAGARVIGFYRSYTGRAPVIEDPELALLREHFQKGPFVFLLLQPTSADVCMAGFRLCRDGELLADPPYTAVQFDPEHLNESVEEPPVVAPAEPEPEVERPRAVAAPPPAPPAPVREAPRRAAAAPLREPPRLPPPYRTRMMEAASAPPVVSEPGRTRWWLPIAICLLGGVGGAAIYELWTLARQPRWIELSLSAKPAAEAGMLAITWDAAAPKAAGATHGLLGITDGGAHRDIALSREQLQTGQYDLKAASQDLDIRLLLYGNGPAVSGSALRLLPAPAPVHAAEIHPAAIAPPPSRPAQVQKARAQTGRSSRRRRR